MTTITITIPNIVINISNTQNLNLEQMASLKEKLADLKAKVNERDTLQASLLTYTDGLLQQVKDAVANSADLQEALNEIDQITEQTKTDNAEIVKALAANTTTPAPTDGGTTTPPATDGGATTPPATDAGGGTSTEPTGPTAPAATDTTTTDATTAPADTTGAPAAPADTTTPPGVTII